MPPLAQWCGYAAITFAVFTLPLLSAIALSGALVLTVLASQTPRLP